MTILLFIRHGENDFLVQKKLPGQLPGIHLNSMGRKQAGQIADALERSGIRAIYASHLERAVETAQPLASRLGLEIVQDKRLADTDAGEWAGHALSELAQLSLWKKIQQDPLNFRYPAGENFQQVMRRVRRILQEIKDQHPGSLVAVFAHGDPIKMAITHKLGLPLKHFQRIQIFPGSISVLKDDGNSVYLVAQNLTPPFSLEEYINY